MLRSRLSQMFAGDSNKHLWRALRTPRIHFNTRVWSPTLLLNFSPGDLKPHHVLALFWQQASCRLWLSDSALSALPPERWLCWRPRSSFRIGRVICRANKNRAVLFSSFESWHAWGNAYFWRRTFVSSAPVWASCTRGLQRSCLDRVSSAATKSSGKVDWKNFNSNQAESSRIWTLKHIFHLWVSPLLVTVRGKSWSTSFVESSKQVIRVSSLPLQKKSHFPFCLA